VVFEEKFYLTNWVTALWYLMGSMLPCGAGLNTWVWLAFGVLMVAVFLVIYHVTKLQFFSTLSSSEQ
jgi:hypothetical protein